MRELLPNARRFAVLLNPAAAASEATSKVLQEAAATLGLKLAFSDASTRDEIDSAFAGFAREKPDTLFIAADGFFAGLPSSSPCWPCASASRQAFPHARKREPDS